MNEASDADTDDRTVLTVRVASGEEAFDDLERRFESLETGTRPTPLHEVVLQREADLTQLLNPNTVELLRTIARESPASIRETARLVDRDVRQVHDDLTELARMNLVTLVAEGRAKRPVVWYDDIDIEVPIADEDSSAAPA